MYSMLGVDKSNTFAFVTSNDMELVDATIISNMNGIILSNDDLSGGSENHHLVATSVNYLVAIQQFGSRPFEITLAGDEESDKHSLHSSSGSCQTQFEFDVGSRNYAVYFLEVVGPEIESILFFKTLDNLNYYVREARAIILPGSHIAILNIPFTNRTTVVRIALKGDEVGTYKLLPTYRISPCYVEYLAGLWDINYYYGGEEETGTSRANG